jgi:hypothetical protein
MLEAAGRSEVDRAPPGHSLAEGRLGARVWLLAIVAQALVLAWVVRTEITGRVFISSWTLSMPGVMLLLGLLAGNAAIRRRPLSRVELIGVFVAVSATATLAGHNFLQILASTLASGVYLQTPENRWGQVMQYVPEWLVPADRDALRGFFHGESPVPWETWLPPLTAWGALVLAVALGTLALNVFLADGWIRRERLAFPIATLPLELTHPEGRLLRAPAMWTGFAVPAVVNTLLALNYYQPAIPAFPHKHTDILDGVTAPPLSLIRPLLVGWTPFVVGLAFLAPLDVSFSVWAFQWLSKLERVVAFSLGLVNATDLGARNEPHLDDQTIGAFLALGALTLWRGVVSPRDRGEAQSKSDTTVRRCSGWAALVCAGFVLGFLVLAGFTLWVASAFLALYALVVAVIARVRSEAGFAWTYGPDRSTGSLGHILANVHGSLGLPERSVALIGFFQWIWWDLRFALMPAQMDALKLGHAAGIRRRQLLALLGGATVLAVVVGLYFVLTESYRFGWGTSKTFSGPIGGARGNLNLALNWMRNPTGPRWDKSAWMFGGGAFTLLLGALRQRFVWWPLHPIGYVMAATPTSHAFWSHYFSAWLAKLLLLRYGGMRLYRQTLPFVLGLILGDVASQTAWSIACAILNVPVYQFVSWSPAHFAPQPPG